MADYDRETDSLYAGGVKIHIQTPPQQQQQKNKQFVSDIFYHPINKMMERLSIRLV